MVLPIFRYHFRITLRKPFARYCEWISRNDKLVCLNNNFLNSQHTCYDFFFVGKQLESYKIGRTSAGTTRTQSYIVCGFIFFGKTQIVKFLYYLSNLNIRENLVGNWKFSIICTGVRKICHILYVCNISTSILPTFSSSILSKNLNTFRWNAKYRNVDKLKRNS